MAHISCSHGDSAVTIIERGCEAKMRYMIVQKKQDFLIILIMVMGSQIADKLIIKRKTLPLRR